ncbi:CRP-like cAMP-binding protein [Bradyrhizobium sp. USDA 4449]
MSPDNRTRVPCAGSFFTKPRPGVPRRNRASGNFGHRRWCTTSYRRGLSKVIACLFSLRQSDTGQRTIGPQMQTGFAFSKLADHLASLAELTEDDLDLLTKMPSTIAHFGSRQAILRHGDASNQCCLLLQGYLSWQDAYGSEGQITSISVPGDIADLRTLYRPCIDGNLIALGPAVVAFVPHRCLRELSMRSPAMSRALLLMLIGDHAIQRNWTINLGSRDALTRAAHLLCEITARLQNVGLARDFRLSSPFTQSDLAAACSISPVHANRTIQELRRCNLLHWHGKTLTISDWPGLVRLAGFDPAYLGLRRRDQTPQQAQSESARADVVPA